MKKLNLGASYVQGFFKGLWKYGLGIALLSLCYALFLNFPLGQDVIIQAGEDPGHFIWAVVSTFFFGFFCWYSYRLLSYEFEKTTADLPEGHRWALEHFPRVLGYNVFLIIPLAVLGLPTLFDFNLLTDEGVFTKQRPWLLFLLLVVGNLYYVLLYWAFKSKRLVAKALAALIGASYMLAWGWVLWKGGNAASHLVHKTSLPLLCLITFIIQLFFVIGVFTRREEGGARNRVKWWSLLDKANSLLISKIDSAKKSQEGDFPLMFHLTAPVAFVAFVVAQFYAPFAEGISALGIAFLGLAMIISSFNLLSFVSLRYRFSWIPMLVLVAIVLGIFMSRYQVRTVPAEHAVNVRPEFNEYMNRWMAMHKDAIDSAKESYYPVYFVISNGGASRSGFWAANVLSKLEEASFVKGDSVGRFSRHILAMASASGGSLGHAVYYSLLREDKPVAEMNEQVQVYFQSDFLSYTLAQLLGADIIRHVLPFIKGDRAVALEKALETSAETASINEDMALPLEQYFDQSGRLPMIFFNTTRVQDGSPGVIGSVSLNGDRIDVLERMREETAMQDRSLRVSTAVLLSARFPYVSPAGGIGKDYYVDGGYYDNSGAGTMYFVLEAVKEYFESDTIYRKQREKMMFFVLHITNHNEQRTKEVESVHPLANDWVAPLLTIAQTSNITTRAGDDQLLDELYLLNGQKRAADDCFLSKAQLYRKSDREDYPMNWVISGYNLARMNKRTTEEVNRLMSESCAQLIKPPQTPAPQVAKK